MVGCVVGIAVVKECRTGFNACCTPGSFVFAGCAVDCSWIGMLGCSDVIVVTDAVDNLVVVGMVGVNSFDIIVVATALGNVEALALAIDHTGVVGM